MEWVTVHVFTPKTSKLQQVNFVYRSLCNGFGQTVQLRDTSWALLRQESYGHESLVSQ